MMSATAKPLSGADLDETAVYQRTDLSGSGPEEPTGNSEMPNPQPAPQTQGRYTFSSGACPLEGYTIKRAIGRGGFGEVYYATSDSGKEVALKLILRNLEVERRGVMQCMNLKCPNLLTIFDLKTNDAGDSFVIMEYVAGPSLASVLKQYPEGLPLSEVRHWLKGLVEGVAYLHDHGIVHRDLKPANLFMEEGIVKIGDYGLAKLITPSQRSEHSESIGTCHYMAPEVGSGKYHKPIDVYAIGVILYEMLTGCVPFDGETVNEVLMKHLTARPDLTVLSEPFRTIVGRALAKDPILRPERVYDLLPPEDAPRIPEVRIIGEGKKGTVPPSAGPAPRSEPEEILHIGSEEPVFYIGPETRPPVRRRTVQERIRANWEALKRPEAYRRSTARPPRPAPARPQPVAARPRPTPVPVRPAAVRVPPPEPPPAPSTRVRVAELTGSMLWAAVMLALLTLPAAAALGVDLERSPDQLAYIFGLGLAGTWAALVCNKLFESRSLDSSTRRLVALIAGLVVGAIAIALGSAMQLDLSPQRQYISNPQRLEPFYFGLLYAASAGWYGLTVRDRRRRFRLLPLFWTALLAAGLAPLWPYERPDGIAVAVLIATTTQIVSPWSEISARYAEYVKAAAKQKRNVREINVTITG
ncbi:MAG: serine/threonine-protein kinase [Isosphaeraceae bacterium]